MSANSIEQKMERGTAIARRFTIWLTENGKWRLIVGGLLLLLNLPGFVGASLMFVSGPIKSAYLSANGQEVTATVTALEDASSMTVDGKRLKEVSYVYTLDGEECAGSATVNVPGSVRVDGPIAVRGDCWVSAPVKYSRGAFGALLWRALLLGVAAFILRPAVRTVLRKAKLHRDGLYVEARVNSVRPMKNGAMQVDYVYDAPRGSRQIHGVAALANLPDDQLNALRMGATIGVFTHPDKPDISTPSEAFDSHETPLILSAASDERKPRKRYGEDRPRFVSAYA
ncbi:hypothetical protein [Magnetofaba australis]|uniref:DUF3592 domain-containing protein n=1 Tax=Magnetofaba australis IT-1 TaxID=1434232 RepID=A0A1Y2K8U2_9PROT|nr:hypothetical protein [Magnetofaba australis]OSM07158.1 hypothetical protein MAIT1_03923 [Magnetofaba australis IT-1]